MIGKIRNFLYKVFSDRLIVNSIFLFLGNSLANFGNYLYHFFSGRFLGPIDYGILASLISLTYFFSVPISGVNLAVTRYTSVFRSENNLEVINFLHKRLQKWFVIFILIVSGFLIILTRKLATFFHIDSSFLFFLMIVFNFLNLCGGLNNSVIAGFQKFDWISISGIITTIVKLGTTVLLLTLGFKILGAVLALLFTAVASLFISAFFLRRLISLKRIKTEIRINNFVLLKYIISATLFSLAFTSLYTTDVILAKHFLSSFEAGLYASLSLLGKIIFFISAPIVSVMFAMVSEKKSFEKSSKEFLKKALLLIGAVCFLINVIYFIFPKTVIKLFFGPQYLMAAEKLVCFGFFVTLYSLCFSIVNFYFSRGKTKVVFFPVLAAIVQLFLIFFFHTVLDQIFFSSLISVSFLFLILIVYYFFEKNARFNF